jgi:nucleolar protein 56
MKPDVQSMSPSIRFGKPWFQIEGLESMDVTLTATVDDEWRVRGTVERRFYPNSITEVDIDDEFLGTLYHPEGDAHYPAVVFLGGSGGGRGPEARAALLAAQGYTTLALAYLDWEGDLHGLPTDLQQIPIEYFEGAIDWLLDHDHVAGDRVGVVGWSKGGELVLVLGAYLNTVGAVVGYVPSGLIWEGNGFNDQRPSRYLDRPVGSTWTYRGEDLPFIPVDPGRAGVAGGILELLKGLVLREPFDITTKFNRAIDVADSHTIEAAMTPVEQTDGPILLISGGEDRLWPSRRLSEFATDRLDANNYDHEYEHVCYEDAGHMICSPAPNIPKYNHEMVSKIVLKWKYGGTPEANAKASRNSRERTREFFDNHFSEFKTFGIERCTVADYEQGDHSK